MCLHACKPIHNTFNTLYTHIPMYSHSYINIHRHPYNTVLHTRPYPHTPEHKHMSYTHKCLYTYSHPAHSSRDMPTSIHTLSCTHTHTYKNTYSISIHTPLHTHSIYTPILVSTCIPDTHVFGHYLNMDEKQKNLGLHVIILHSQ